jgi:hypothetical protein
VVWLTTVALHSSGVYGFVNNFRAARQACLQVYTRQLAHSHYHKLTKFTYKTACATRENYNLVFVARASTLARTHGEKLREVQTALDYMGDMLACVL